MEFGRWGVRYRVKLPKGRTFHRQCKTAPLSRGALLKISPDSAAVRKHTRPVRRATKNFQISFRTSKTLQTATGWQGKYLNIPSFNIAVNLFCASRVYSYSVRRFLRFYFNYFVRKLTQVVRCAAMFRNTLHVGQTDCRLIPAILQSQNPAPTDKFRRI